MKERRSLIEGLKTDTEQQEAERVFVYGSKRRQEPVERSASISTNQSVDDEPIAASNPITEVTTPSLEARTMLQMKGRVPVTARCRPEIATALKQISLKRQLAGLEPYHVQNIVEEAIENWIKSHPQG